MTLLRCLLAAAVVSSAGADVATLTLFDSAQYPYARCLDGSPSGLYLRRSPAAPTATASTSWLFMLDGGGACTHEEDCVARSKGKLGSSKGWNRTVDLNQASWTSDDERLSPSVRCRKGDKVPSVANGINVATPLW